MAETRQHLSEEEVAQCADAINSGHYKRLNSDLKHHLSHCDDCAAEVLMVADIAFDFKSVVPQSKILSLKPWYIAGATLVAAGVAFLFLFNFSPKGVNHSHENNQIALTDSIAPNKDIDNSQSTIDGEEQYIAESDQSSEHIPEENPPPQQSDLLALYTPDPTLEQLSQNFTQAYRGEHIRVLTANVINLPGADSLKWTNPRNGLVYIEIFNNKGEKVVDLKEKSNGIPMPSLSKGLHYWKLISEEFDLLFVGKIVVE